MTATRPLSSAWQVSPNQRNLRCFQDSRFWAQTSPNLQNQRMIFDTYCWKWVFGLGPAQINKIYVVFKSPDFELGPARIYKINIWCSTHIVENEFLGLGQPKSTKSTLFSRFQILGSVQPKSTKSTYDFWRMTNLQNQRMIFNAWQINKIYVVFKAEHFRLKSCFFMKKISYKNCCDFRKRDPPTLN